jgi:hypothetical protein
MSPALSRGSFFEMWAAKASGLPHTFRAAFDTSNQDQYMLGSYIERTATRTDFKVLKDFELALANRKNAIRKLF